MLHSLFALPGGVGSQLVARFVEEASGMTISKCLACSVCMSASALRYMEERIFRPAAMCSTGFVIDESLAKNCVSTDYHPWVLSSVADGVPSKWSRLRQGAVNVITIELLNKSISKLPSQRLHQRTEDAKTWKLCVCCGLSQLISL